MQIKTFKAEYELIEFSHYIDHSHDEPVSVIDLIVRTNDIDYLIDELGNLFASETDRHSYVFSGYEISEYYEVGEGLVKEFVLSKRIKNESVLVLFSYV